METYDKLRFANEGGQYVHSRESEAILKVLTKHKDKTVIVDIPTGTGRMLSRIVELNFLKIVAADYSDTMLNFCKFKYHYKNIEFRKEDIYHLSFRNESCSCITCNRFLFHCSDQDALFRELARVLKQGGVLTVDSISWSPRSWIKLFLKKLGGNLYTNCDKSIKKLAKKYGFSVIFCEAMFIFPSFFYNFFPKWFLNSVISLEKIWPKQFLSKRVWGLQKNE